MDKRKRKRRKKRSAVANVRRRLRERYLLDSKTAKASEYLYHLKQYHKQYQDMIVVIYIRVSTGAQGYKRNLDTYEKVLRWKLKKLNITIIACYREVGSGWVLDGDREVLVNAAKEAKKEKAVIVAPSADRFLRNKNFNTKTNPDVLPTEAEFEELKKLTGNVPLVTLLHPDRPPRKVRRYQTKWGQKVKGNSGGRPKENKPGYMKLRRQIKLPQMLRRRKKGESLGAISKATDVPKSTVADWVRRYG